MRRLLYSVLFLLLAGSAFAAPADAIVARVNGEVIMLSQLREAALDEDVPIGDITSAGIAGAGFRRTLTLLVDEALLVQRAQKEEIKIDDITIARDVDRMIQELEKQLGSHDALEKYLKDHSLSFNEFRDMLSRRERRRLLSTQVVARRVKTDAASIADFEKKLREQKKPAETVRLAHILIAVRDRQEDGAEAGKAYKTALALARKAASDPARFGELARANSQDAATRRAGGDLGWLDPSSLNPALRDAALELQMNDISDPVWGGDGWHLLQLTDRRDMRDVYFADAFARERTKLIEQLRKEASIKIYDPNK
ncbi:peptidylprolyl isomerase [bacterium]|nr:peptidylprolyl isomerase [bacterium]